MLAISLITVYFVFEAEFMTKKTEVVERAVQGGKMTALRIDPKLRYLADIAATAKGESLTKYVERALADSFEHVTLRLPPEPEVIYNPDGTVTPPEALDLEEERVANEAMSIANKADLLWSESEFLRLTMLDIVATHLVSDDDHALLNYINNRKDLRINVKGNGSYKLDRKKIDAEWESIKAAHIKAMKGKVR